MQQDERPPPPMSLVVEVDAVDLGILAGARRARGPIAAHCHAPSTGEKSGSADTDSEEPRNSSVRGEGQTTGPPSCERPQPLARPTAGTNPRAVRRGRAGAQPPPRPPAVEAIGLAVEDRIRVPNGLYQQTLRVIRV